jgi:hypothetical protein
LNESVENEERHGEENNYPRMVQLTIRTLPTDARSLSADDAGWNDDGKHLLVLADLVAVLLDDGKHGCRSGRM